MYLHTHGNTVIIEMQKIGDYIGILNTCMYVHTHIDKVIIIEIQKRGDYIGIYYIMYIHIELR